MRFTKSVAKSAHCQITRLRGLCVPEDRTIWISSRQSRIDQERTFVHELLHAASGACRSDLEREAEEWAVGRIEEPLHSVLVSGEIALEEV